MKMPGGDAVGSGPGRMVGVDGPVDVDVEMMMAAIFQPAGEAPEKISQTEKDEGPGRQIAADAFERLDLGQAEAEDDPDRPEENGAPDMAQAAEGGDGRRLARRHLRARARTMNGR